jgi:riboflavin kinase/FMN adenylyltransferase
LKVIENYKKFNTTEKSIVTIGTFDGVHIGHQKIIEQLVATAKKENSQSVLLTFFPHPRMVLQKDNSIKLINSIEERIAFLEKTGLDCLIIHPFDKAFSRLTALEFVRNVLVNHLNTSKLIVGYDHRFGKNREGNFEQLEEYGHVYDFEVIEIPSQDINEIAVSSTKIRTALQEGDVKKANRYLGRSFSISGEVVSGERLGNTIGFPTANIKIPESYKLTPKKGAYLVKAQMENTDYYGMLNIGVRPTVNGVDETIEVHFFDWDKDLYGKTLEIQFLDFLREEQRFESVRALKAQLSQDKIKSYSLIQG